MSIRKDYVSLATSSYQDLESVINDLTTEELREALSLESQTNRRMSIINRMIGRLVRINEIQFKLSLQKEYISWHDNHPK